MGKQLDQRLEASYNDPPTEFKPTIQEKK